MNQPPKPDGCIILEGLRDWQILQRDASGMASVTLRGNWSIPSPEKVDPQDRKEPFVTVRVVSERNGAPVTAALDWHAATTLVDGTWEARLDIPAGGLYRVETAVNRGRVEWGYHGDTVHHVGVGDLWVIAGQSNAAGYGRGYIDDAPELGIHLLGNDEKWRLATHPLNDTRGNTHPNCEECNPRHSPFLAFARLLKRELAIPIGLVQTALGGSPLRAWNPVENPEAPLYHNLIHCVRLAGGKVAGVGWYQGESDAGPERALTYRERFGQFVESVRRDLGQPELPFVTTQLNRVIKSEPTATENLSWSQLREQQRQAVHQLQHVALVSAVDLPLSDLIHISPAGNLILGQRLAAAALEMKDGKDRAARFPEIVSAQFDPDRKGVILEFWPVRFRLLSDYSVVKEFVVEDEQGSMNVVASEFIRKDRIWLKLDREPGAKAVVHGQSGTSPLTHIYEVETNRPLLAFHSFPISG
jgi:hypothetical protein